MRWPHHRWALALGAIYAILFAALAIAPYSRADWLLENALALAFVSVLVLTANRFPFSRVSYTAFFLFLVLHTIGAHYTYSLVPYDMWGRALLGFSIDDFFGWERNHYDRFVHFSYGLLFAYPIRELVLRVADVRGFWGYFLPLDVTMSTSLAYELIEWAAAHAFGGKLGMEYLGTQGDVWDSHRDMALAALGALVTIGLTTALNAIYQRDFAREWAESVRVKRLRPLGEERIIEVLDREQ